MIVNTKHRSEATEMMDDFTMEGEILRDALDKIASINQLLGGNKVTLDGVKHLISGQPAGTLFRISDIGCGNGDMLRALADYAEIHQLNFILTGIDANQFTIEYARKCSAGYHQIQYQCTDVFDPKERMDACDIVLCTLTLHHFTNGEILRLLKGFQQSARIGFVINDLQRSRLAYYLFVVLCRLFRLNHMSREDGLVSILRGFKKKDLLSYSNELQFKQYLITWKWAFRYQWIVKTT